jgi:ribosomal protein L12E/L44/L45/RPP1/RPP2
MMRRVKVAALPGTSHSDENSRAATPSLEHLSEHYTKSELEDYRQLFCMFDTDGSGAISNEELKAAIISIGLQVSDEEIDDLIKEVRFLNLIISNFSSILGRRRSKRCYRLLGILSLHPSIADHSQVDKRGDGPPNIQHL